MDQKKKKRRGKSRNCFIAYYVYELKLRGPWALEVDGLMGQSGLW